MNKFLLCTSTGCLRTIALLDRFLLLMQADGTDAWHQLPVSTEKPIRNTTRVPLQPAGVNEEGLFLLFMLSAALAHHKRLARRSTTSWWSGVPAGIIEQEDVKCFFLQQSLAAAAVTS